MNSRQPSRSSAKNEEPWIRSTVRGRRSSASDAVLATNVHGVDRDRGARSSGGDDHAGDRRAGDVRGVDGRRQEAVRLLEPLGGTRLGSTPLAAGRMNASATP